MYTTLKSLGAARRATSTGSLEKDDHANGSIILRRYHFVQPEMVELRQLDPHHGRQLL
jgi:hypothetical protein